MRAALILTLTAALAAGCQYTDPGDITQWPADKLLAEARDATAGRAYTRALEYLAELEKRFPYNKYGRQAMLEKAYIHHRQKKPEEARAAAERFIEQYPAHPSVDYAYYLKGLSGYDDAGGPIRRLMGRFNLRTVDPGAARDSHEAFADLLSRFPHSRYAADAREKMEQLVNALAWHEIDVARFYLDRQAYVAAVGRSKTVLEKYSGTPAAEEALAILVTTYRAMGLPRLSEDARRVLQLNFPQSRHL